MAKHKAATQVTIVQEERSSFGQLVDRLWRPAAAVAAIGAGLIVGVQYSQARSHAAVAAEWDTLGQAMSVDPFSGRVIADAEELKEALDKLPGTAARSWGQVALVTSLVEDRNYTEAMAALGELRSQGVPEFTEQLYTFGESKSQMTLADHLERTIAGQRKWEEGRGSLFENPELPAGSPRARIETSAGNIVVGLFQDRAPKHVENFLKLCDEDFYAGTNFHRVIRGFMIQGGDPNTKDGDPSTWGQGGPGYKIDVEKNDLHHFRGYLAAAKQSGQVQSSGSQFFITLGDALHLDGQHVVFGVVLEGMDVAEEIGQGEIDPTSSTRDRPTAPISIQRVSKIE